MIVNIKTTVRAKVRQVKINRDRSRMRTSAKIRINLWIEVGLDVS